MLPAGTLHDQVAIITGGGTGMGKAMALNFAQLGAKIVVASRKLENLEATVREIEAAGGEALAVQTDVRDPAQVANMVERTKERFGGIDILINNAAGNFVARAEDLSPNAWNAVVGIVLNGTWFCTQAVAKEMMAQGRGGKMVNIIATYVWTGGPGTAASAAAKAGVLSLTQSLSVEWARHNIRINAIAPGPVATENTTRQLFGGGDLIARIAKEVPLGRFGDVDEIANAAAYLVSDYAAYVTGTCLTVDGGSMLNKGYLKYLDKMPERPQK
ncbi:MAG: SDR family oxidoreductase [Chloroflexi bacterium]|nr:SDR family oxidoreductase [Chloroflexota bacterium]OJV86897.1 MAG: 2,4-dienoyl-CoA reductase [Chloroflexi bacterium 54-19]